MQDSHTPDPAVLVVDDNEQARCALARILKFCGIPTAAAANGRLALEYLRGHTPPRLIVLDLVMPVMDGLEFLREQKHDPALAAIPVLVLSSEAELYREALQADGCAVEVKPMEPERLIERLRQSAGASPPERGER